MFKRLLVICAVLVLLLSVSVSADPPVPNRPPGGWGQGWKWERNSLSWAPPSDNRIMELEFTMRFEPPSNYTGIYETEISLKCPTCWPDQVYLEPGIFLLPETSQALVFFCIIEQIDPKVYMFIEDTDVGWWRRYHQFRWIVEHIPASNQIRARVWDCDTQELLVDKQDNVNPDITQGYAFDWLNATFEYTHPSFDGTYGVWEGHWTRNEDQQYYRWDRAPWDTGFNNGYWWKVVEDYDTIRNGPTLHLYDDHDRACTGGVYWPTSQQVPLFDGNTSSLSPEHKEQLMALLSRPDRERDAVMEEMRVSATVPEVEMPAGPFGPEGPPEPPREFPQNAFMPHVFNELEGQAHWNRGDMWWECD